MRNLTHNWRLLLVWLALLPTLVPGGISVYVCLTSAQYHVRATGGCLDRGCCEDERPVADDASRSCCSNRAPDPVEGPVSRTAPCDCCIELASFETDEFTIPGAQVMVDLDMVTVAPLIVRRGAAIAGHCAPRCPARPPGPPLSAPLLL